MMTWITRVLAPAAAALLLGSVSCSGYYFSDVVPITFKRGEEVSLKVNAITSIRTQIPIDYYRLPFCRHSGGPKMVSQNLGEFLTGNKIQSSPYHIKMPTEMHCVKLCQVTLTGLEAANLSYHIKHAYHNNWIIDNVPSASMGISMKGYKTMHYAGGFPIGFIEPGTKRAYVYNHVNINISINYDQPYPKASGYRIVGFSVEPMSIKHEFQGGYEWDGVDVEGFSKKLNTCSSESPTKRSSIKMNQVVKAGERVLYTYDVTWEQSDVPWASRWDVYFSEDYLVPDQVHWYSIVNSLTIALILSSAVACILVHNLKNDKADHKKNESETAMSKWKSLHMDVFRPPLEYTMQFCVMVGTGVQILATALFVIIMSALGIVSPARRGYLVMTMIILYSVFGCLGGYCSCLLYKTFGGSDSKKCFRLTATLFPGLCFGIVCIINNFLFAMFQSTGSIPFSCLVILLLLWGALLAPSVYVGSFFGFKADPISFPTLTSTVVRDIPANPNCLCRPGICMATAGALPFAALYVEMFFIMTSLWMYQFYYTFGFALIVFCLMLITCAEVVVLIVYFRLRAENHQWWWYSFFAGGSVAFYILGYACFWHRSLEAAPMIAAHWLYFTSMLLICCGVFLVTGAVGVLASLWFIRKLFSTISQNDIDQDALLMKADEMSEQTWLRFPHTSFPII